MVKKKAAAFAIGDCETSRNFNLSKTKHKSSFLIPTDNTHAREAPDYKSTEHAEAIASRLKLKLVCLVDFQ